MSKKPPELIQNLLPESVLIFNENKQEWEIAFNRNYKRIITEDLISAFTFNEASETKTSIALDCSAYQKGLLLLNIDVTGAPTDIYFRLQFSDNRVDWFNYVIGPFGDLRFEDSAGDQKVCLDFPILAPYLRLYAVSSGCEATKTFLVTAKIILNG